MKDITPLLKALSVSVFIFLSFTKFAYAEMEELKINLKGHVVFLSQKVGERNFISYDKLEKASDYISKKFRSYGYTPEDQDYYLEGRRFRNMIATKFGENVPEEVVIVGAHYDSVVGSPGADDNASAVAGLLELARLISTAKLSKTIKFIAFTNEEPPFFLTKEMGSMVYVRQAKRRKENIIAMIALEMLGYFSDAPNSQSYPFGLSFFYPSVGNYIAVCGNLRSRGLVKKIKEVFGQHSNIDVESLLAPGFFVPAIEFSDNSSFWRGGYRAVMVTDTAFYRNPYYHSPGDTYEKLDYERMAEVVKGLYQVLIDLGGSEK